MPVVNPAAPRPAHAPAHESDWASVAPLLGIGAQLAAMLGLLYWLEIEAGSGLPILLPVLFCGFLLNAGLQERYRLPFFLFLSFGAFGLVLGPWAAALLVLVGLALIGICHLPFSFSTRVLLVVQAGAALAAVRAGWAPAALGRWVGDLPVLVLPVLGSMFMFRLIIYMYDLRSEERERAAAAAKGAPARPSASIWTRLSYFFLLPNVCFLLFPIVDFRTFRRSYYDGDEHAIYRRGVGWIGLGLVYLLAYRFVYHFLLPAPEQVQDLGGVVRFMSSSYLVYLRVVGQFHLITGFLCLFGFNLPPAHRFFLLAGGFTDFWRRARIEWKDFMVKVFYFPVLVPSQRRWGATAALVLGTLVVFVATWLLHGYQWFWLIGDLRLSRTDAVFWTIIGGCVLVNSLLEARRGRARATRAGEAAALRDATVHAAKVLGMFVFMCVLWSYWSSPSVAVWLSYLSAAAESGPADWILLVAGLAGAVGVGVAAQRLPSWAPRISGALGGGSRRRQMAPALGFAVLLVLGIPASRGVFGEPAALFATTLSTNRLNSVDQQRADRGYYEVLLDEPRSSAGWLDRSQSASVEPVGVAAGEEMGMDDFLAGAARARGGEGGAAPAPAPADRGPVAGGPAGRAAARADGAERIGPMAGLPFIRMTGDMMAYELVAGDVGSYKGAPFRISESGLWDRAYTRERPAGAYRIALLGSSFTMGAGVPMELNHESLLEERLNREGPGAPQRRYEILNFSVGGYGVLNNVEVAEQKAFAFEPQVVLVVIHNIEPVRMLDQLAQMIRVGTPITHPYVRQKLEEAGVEAGMEEPELRRRLQPITLDLLRWCYGRILELGRERDVPVVGIAFPTPTAPRQDPENRGLRRVAGIATEAGLPVLSLEGVYDGREPETVMLTPQDSHLNELGHRLVADRLWELLRENARQLGLVPR